MRKSAIALAASVVVAAAAVGLSKPTPLAVSVSIPAIHGDLDTFIADSESAAAKRHPLIPGAEKRIRWQNQGEKTELALVYLHGFSGTRQGLAPVPDRVADALSANLFETRLTGHGLARGGLTGVRAEDWLADGVEAIEIGSRLGERVIVMGTSTGATLAVALADHPVAASVEAVVMISPNFRPYDAKSEWVTWPGGPWLLRMLVGSTHSFEPANAEQARYWTTTYPTDAIVEMMRLVDLANSKPPRSLGQPLLTLYSAHDQVVSYTATLEALEKLDSPYQTTVELGEVGDRANHLLAGDILSPESTGRVVDLIVEFVRSIPDAR